MLQPYQALQCTPTATYGLDKHDVPQLGPVRQPADDAGRGARPVVRHLLLPTGLPVLSRATGAERPHAAVGARSSASAPRRGSTSASEAGRARADACLAEEGVHRSDSGPGRGTRGTQSSSRSASRTSQVTPLQMARFYAMIANGGKLVTPYVVSQVETAAPNGQSPVVEAALRPGHRRSRSASTPPRCRSSVTGSTPSDPLDIRHVLGRVRELPDPDRGQDGHRREGGAGSRVSDGPHAGPVLVVRLGACPDRARASSSAP